MRGIVRLLLFGLAAAFLLGAWTARHPRSGLTLPHVKAGVAHAGVAMPDRRLTPGATVAGLTTWQLCHKGAGVAGAVPAGLRRQVLARYHVPGSRAGRYQVDHLVPVEIGGSDDLANLWPQPLAGPAGAQAKDRLDRWLRREVCAGHLPLASTQRKVAADWYETWVEAGRP